MLELLPPPQPPTSFLPPLARLSSTSSGSLTDALGTLRKLYFPRRPPPIFAPKSKPLRAFKASHHPVHGGGGGGGADTPLVVDSGYASAEENDDDEHEHEHDDEGTDHSPLRTLLPPPGPAVDDDDEEHDPEALEILRKDPFERAFVIKWLTGFIARAEPWISSCTTTYGSGSGAGDDEDTITTMLCDDMNHEEILRSEILEDAITLLSSFSGEDEYDADRACGANGDLTRTFTFPVPPRTPYGSATQVEVELNDAEVSSEDHTSVGLQSWGSSILFAEKLCADPGLYLRDTRPLLAQQDEFGRPLRILELGAGTGMLSIVTAKLFGRSRAGGQLAGAAAAAAAAPEIVATDYHPDVLGNLAKNIETNFPSASGRQIDGPEHAPPVSVEMLDWESPRDDAPFDERFDVILAADCVYHPDHARWIRDCVGRLLRRPGPGLEVGNGETGRIDRGGIFWMFIAVRGSGRHEGLDKSVDAVFETVSPCVDGDDEEGRRCVFGEDKLVIEQVEDVQKQGGIGRADEGSYKLWKIRWG